MNPQDEIDHLAVVGSMTLRSSRREKPLQIEESYSFSRRFPTQWFMLVMLGLRVQLDGAPAEALLRNLYNHFMKKNK